MGSKKKKGNTTKKMTLQLSSKQYRLLKLHSKYTGNSTGKMLKKAVNIYLKQVSHDLECWKKISPEYELLSEADKSKQMEIQF